KRRRLTLLTTSERSGDQELLGKETPRLFTPPLRELTDETSFGFEAIEVAETLLGERLYPWQRWFLKHSLELAPGSHTYDEFPKLRYSTVLLLVARQCGKSFIMSRRLLWRLLMTGRGWKRRSPRLWIVTKTSSCSWNGSV